TNPSTYLAMGSPPLVSLFAERRRVHVEDFPVVAVRIVEAPAVHEAVIDRVERMRSTRGDRGLDHAIDLRAARAVERAQSFAVRLRVADPLLRALLEALLDHQHDERFVADDHARALLVRESRVEREAERGEEADRALEVGHRQIQKQFSRLI